VFSGQNHRSNAGLKKAVKSSLKIDSFFVSEFTVNNYSQLGRTMSKALTPPAPMNGCNINLGVGAKNGTLMYNGPGESTNRNFQSK
jgi:hypothetical protein